MYISDIDFGIHRQRSSTAQRLEKMDQDRKKTNRIKHVKWEWNPVVLTGNVVNLFITSNIQETRSYYERQRFLNTCKFSTNP